MKKTVLLASALLMGAAMPALANDMSVKSDAEIQAKFTKLDTDKSGSLSSAEFEAAGKSDSDFTAADTNKDSSVSLAELTTWKKDKWGNKSDSMNGKGSNAVDNSGSATGSGTSSVGGANERVREGMSTKTAH